MIEDYSEKDTDNINLLEEIRQAIASKDYGSIEIYIEAGRVVQITERSIHKINKPETRRPNYIYSRPNLPNKR